ncbi:hypothetical protein DFQ09_102239 [Winogradskyella pacifica]|uniref:Uncharacterized protein n=1 Tax=Winogradskyella pacifica TaxID=664642 RepID=A0A3D9N1U0_9FLAO|nr:hypothetical protein [Winogradskyella pacifica]REE25648.1 hypothetical protein DFQ09_102239 [Winogradskyella pacifica]
MESTIKNIELLYTPLTKQLLINFVKFQYEENADISDDSLKTELIWLHNNNQLDQLFIGEYLQSESRLNL